MSEARIIPINAEQRAEGDRGAEEAVAPTRRNGRRVTAKPAPKTSAKAGSQGPKAAPASAPRATERAGSEAEDRDHPRVEPPETLRDMGSFVTGKSAESKAPAEAAPARPAVVPEPPAEPQRTLPTEPETEQGDEWERKLAGALAFLRRRLTGEYEVDEFGFDAELTGTILAAPFRPLYDKWFRVEATGMENVPEKGGALIVANHSGTIALDGVITALALLDHHPGRRHLRMLGADLVFKTPFVGEFARKAGNTLACQADAERLLSNGELVGVYPEGFKGVGKPFSERYKLQRFGRGGFVSSALKTKAPIIPCSIVGAEEIYPMLGNSKLLARLMGAPYFPLTPTFPWLGPLGLIPLPSKWYIEFGEPIDTAPLADRADDPMLVFNVADQVRETIQQTLYRLLMKRKSVFL
jgi:1-acyl-sn-glycerol-3-phosphate acyltransferase